ncbi:hypothetical protein B0T22DRAFT_478662 [Podospora appendiculata]|uniref:Prp 4 CRoW domain-containing protein n=1 Tax=Podospora appendiculata TaxID=314037 RepID=A0AAE0X727_9PEZI|nr:hypothetical protein B0T22DRAFT_478662 [Podospora appendiculata]
MLAKSLTALAAFAFAVHAAVEPMPYKAQPKLMKMSVRQMFGVVRRDEPGYQPTQAVCGTGATCAQACGDGYTTCKSTDSQVHCFNPAAAQTCCPDESGNSCDAGYYCAADSVKGTWCCPDGMSLTACAAAYSVTGGLVSETAKPTSSSASSTSTTVSTTAPPTTTSTTSSSFSADKNSTVFATKTDTVTSSCSSTLVPSLSYPASNTTSISFVGTPGATPTPSATKIPEAAGNMMAPGSALLILAAGVALLL